VFHECQALCTLGDIFLVPPAYTADGFCEKRGYEKCHQLYIKRSLLSSGRTLASLSEASDQSDTNFLQVSQASDQSDTDFLRVSQASDQSDTDFLRVSQPGDLNTSSSRDAPQRQNHRSVTGHCKCPNTSA